MIERVVAPNPGPMTLTGTNTYLVTTAAGDVAVIDPGPDDPHHLEAILAAAKPLGTITTILVTHRHLDHIPAARPLSQRTGAPLVGHPDLPGVERPVREGQSAFGSLEALETPGHTRDSLCFWDADDGALFTGDLVLGYGTAVLDDHPTALADYFASLHRLQRLKPTTIYPGHGPIVEDAAAKLAEYVVHRQQRVQQVVDVLAASGAATTEDLVRAIYTDVPSNLVPMAARNVRANLDLLAAEGRAERIEADRWHLTRTR